MECRRGWRSFAGALEVVPADPQKRRPPTLAAVLPAGRHASRPGAPQGNRGNVGRSQRHAVAVAAGKRTSPPAASRDPSGG